MDNFLGVGEIKITPEILRLIAEIDEFKGAWQMSRLIAKDRLKALKKVATIESIGSSTRIEGANLTDSAIQELLLDTRIDSFETRDQQEVAGYAFTCEQIYLNYEHIPLTENTIKQMHIWLLQYVEKDERHRGEYKKIPIRIEAFDSSGQSIGTLFETTSPLETPIKMQELIHWTTEALKNEELHPLLIIGIFVVLFLAIHPFQDGNGRLSRLLTTLLLLKTGYAYAPYTSLESIIESNKDAYYLALQNSQKKWQNHAPDWMPWLLFFLHCLQRQKKHLEIKIDREKILMKELPALSQKIIILLEEHGSLKISELVAMTNANRNTLKKVIISLVHKDFIKREGQGKGSRYILQ